MDLCPQVLYIQHDEKHGAPSARNAGIRAAAGEYIAFLDDDDEWLPDKTEKQLTGFKKDDIALVYGTQPVCNDIAHVVISPNREYYSGKVYSHLLETDFIGSTSNPLIRKSCIEAVGCFDEEMRSAQDYDLFLRLAQRYEIKYIPQICMIYHVHEGTRISTTYTDKVLGQERLIRKFAQDLEKNPKAWAEQHRRLIKYYKHIGNSQKAFRTWRSIVHKAPYEIRKNIKSLLICLLPRDNFLVRWHQKQYIRKMKKRMDSKMNETESTEKICGKTNQ